MFAGTLLNRRQLIHKISKNANIKYAKISFDSDNEI